MTRPTAIILALGASIHALLISVAWWLFTGVVVVGVIGAFGIAGWLTERAGRWEVEP